MILSLDRTVFATSWVTRGEAHSLMVYTYFPNAFAANLCTVSKEFPEFYGRFITVSTRSWQ